MMAAALPWDAANRGGLATAQSRSRARYLGSNGQSGPQSQTFANRLLNQPGDVDGKPMIYTDACQVSTLFVRLDGHRSSTSPPTILLAAASIIPHGRSDAVGPPMGTGTTTRIAKSAESAPCRLRYGTSKVCPQARHPPFPHSAQRDRQCRQFGGTRGVELCQSSAPRSAIFRRLDGAVRSSCWRRCHTW